MSSMQGRSQDSEYGGGGGGGEIDSVHKARENFSPWPWPLIRIT